MLRLIHDVPRWHVYLHREARELPSVGRDDAPERKLEDELFDKLYAGGASQPVANDNTELGEWAGRLHALCDELPAFQRLQGECLGDVTASAIAVETLMAELAPHLGQPPDPAALRRSAVTGCERSSAAIEQNHEAVEGLSAVGFGSGAGPGSAMQTGPTRNLARRLKQDSRLARIALLAGKFKRIAAQKQRAKVRHGADEVADIETGGTVSQLLPSELVKFTSPRTRLAFLADVMERRALQYRLQGTDSLGKGPLVLCVDKSGSMDGAKDLWATAVALALLDVAHRQQRPFALLAFDGAVKHEAIVGVGQALPEEALFVTASGGTDITAALTRAMSIIESNGTSMKKADVVLITDGESDDSGAPVIRQLAERLKVTVLGFGIGVDVAALRPWCDEVQAITRLDSVDERAAEMMFGV